MSKSMSITMNFGTASAKRGGAEVSSVFKGISADARRTGQEVTKSLNVRMQPLVRNLGEVEKALRRIQDIAKSGRLAEIIKAADAVARAEVSAAQRAAREKEKLAGDAVKRSQKVADAEAREAARMERVKVMAAERAADRETKAAQAAERERTRVLIAGMQAANRIEAEKLRAAEAAERQKVAATERAERDRQNTAQRAARTQNTPSQSPNIGGGIQSAGRGIATAGAAITASITAPLILAERKILQIGTAYETAMSVFQATTRASADELKAAGDAAERLGADMELPKTSAVDAAKAMTELAKGGFTARQSIEAARGTLLLAAAAQVTEAQAAEISANAINMFSLSAADAARVADLLAAASNASSAEITDVAESLKMAGAVFAANKVPIQDTVTLIGLLANAGMKGSDAGTSLKTMLMRLVAPTKEARGELKALGISVFDAQGKLKPMRDIIEQFAPVLAKMSDEQRNATLATIFGQDAIRAATIILGQGVEAYDRMNEAVTRQGAAAELAAAKTKGLGGAWEGFKSQLETVALVIYKMQNAPLENILRGAAEWIGKATEALKRLNEEHPKLGAFAIAFVALLGVIGPVVTALGGLVLIVGAAVSALGTIATAVAALGGVGPVLAIVGAALAALVVVIAAVSAQAAILYQAWTNNFGGIRDYALEVFDTIGGAVNAVLSFVRELWAKYGAEIITTANQVWTAVLGVARTALTALVQFSRENLSEIVKWTRENWPLIKETVEIVLVAVGTTVKYYLTAIQAFWSQHGEQIKAIVSAAWTIIKTVVSTGGHLILDVIRLIMQTIKGDWAGAWDTYVGILKRGIEASGTVLKSFLTIAWNVLKALGTVIANNAAGLAAAAVQLGKAIVDGMVNGIKSGFNRVKDAAKELAIYAITGAKVELKSKSPSRVFMGIGRDVALGFILGIGSMQAEADAAVKKLVVPPAVKTMTGKGSAKVNHALRAKDKLDRPGWELLEDLRKQAAELVPAAEKTKELQVRAELAAAKYRQLREDIRAAIIEEAKDYDAKKAALEIQATFTEILKQQNQELGFQETHVDEINRRLAEPGVLAALDARTVAMLRLKAAMLDYEKSIKDVPLAPVGITTPLPLGEGPTVNPSEVGPAPPGFERQIEAIRQAEKVRDYLEGIADDITNIFGRAIDDWDGSFKGFFTSVVQGFKQMFQQIVKDFLLSGINKIVRGMLGLPTGTGGGTTSGSGGGILDAVGKFFGGLFGGGSSSKTSTGGILNLAGSGTGLALNSGSGGGIGAVFGNTAFGPSINSPTSLSTSTLTQQVANQSFSSSAKSTGKSLGGLLSNAGSLFKGIGFNSKPGTGGALAAMLPMLGASLGGSLVGALAGPQAGGLANILGMVGGGLIGVGLTATPAIFAAGGALSSLGPVAGALFSNPVTAIVGGALLVGAVLLGKQKQRRADEKARDASMVSSLSALNALLKGVNSDQIMVADALTQAAQVRQDYLNASQALKDKKTRNIALKDVSRLDAVVDQIKAAGVGQKDRLEMVANRKPEFARGGVIPGRPGQPVDMVGHGQEIVVNWNQLTGVGAAVMALAGVPGIGGLPFSIPQVTPNRSAERDARGSDGGGDIRIEELRVGIDAGGIFCRGGRTRDGRRLIVETIVDEQGEGGLER